ncbi:hypothetical protein ACYULU_12070, partial [Breznakiellaceae bacterium SP9]
PPPPPMKHLDFIKPGYLNFISPFGLGDTLRLAGLKSVLERKYHAPLHFIIEESHRLIMDMYEITDFSVHGFSEEALKRIGEENPIPRPGFLYAAHPLYSDKSGFMEKWDKTPFHVDELFETFLGLDKDTERKPPLKYPPVLPGLEKTVLLLPDARSVPAVSEWYWRELASRLVGEGYTVVQNYTRKENRIQGVRVVEGNLEEITAYALSCRKVYSLRSGLCDLLAGKLQRFCVVYPNEHTRIRYSMKRAFPEQELEEELAEAEVPRRGVVRAAKGAVKKVLHGMGILEYGVR